MPQGEKASITHDGRVIEYTIVRSERRKKTIQTSLHPNGEVVVRAPLRTDKRHIDNIVRDRAAWIVRKRDEMLSAKTEQSGGGLPETLHYHGEDVRLGIERADVGEPVACLREGAFRIRIPRGLDEAMGAAAARGALERWYAERAAVELPPLVEEWRERVAGKGKRVNAVRIGNQKTRWGSCSSNGNIRLNWRLVMAAPDLAEYVVVHELAHMVVMNHSAGFWAVVARHVPDHRERRRRLNVVGRGYWF